MQPQKFAIAKHAINEDHCIAFDQRETLMTEDRFWTDSGLEKFKTPSS